LNNEKRKMNNNKRKTAVAEFTRNTGLQTRTDFTDLKIIMRTGGGSLTLGQLIKFVPKIEKFAQEFCWDGQYCDRDEITIQTLCTQYDEDCVLVITDFFEYEEDTNEFQTDIGKIILE